MKRLIFILTILLIALSGYAAYDWDWETGTSPDQMAEFHADPRFPIITLSNGFTQDNINNNALEWNENGDELIWTFGSNTVTLSSGDVTLFSFGTIPVDLDKFKVAAVTYTLPSADGTNGYQLTTDSAGTLSWAAAGTSSPAGNDTYIQYNNGGALGGIASFIWDDTNIEVADDVNTAYGTDGDWFIQYDESVDNQLLIRTNGTAAAAITDPMCEILVGTTPTADQQVFGVAKGKQASNTALFTVDEDGDVEIAGDLTVSGAWQIANLTVTGSAVVGNGTGTVQFNTSSWDISTGGAASGFTTFSLSDDISLANGKSVKGSTTNAETLNIQAYDVDNTTYRNVINLTNGNTIAAVIGTNYETVAVNSADWDISTTGAMTGIGAITSDGTVTTTGVGGVVSPIFTAAATTNIGSKISRNQGTTTAMLLELETTNTGDDRSALLIDHNANTAVDAAQIENDGTAAGLHITGAAAGSVGIDVDVADSATGRVLYGDLGPWLGTAGEGAIELLSDSDTTIAAGQLVRLNQQGTGKHASAIGGSVIYVADAATAPDSGTSYAVYLNPTNIEAMHVDNGDVLVDDKVQAGTLQATTLLDIDEDVDADFDAADEEVNITASAKDYATGSGVVTVYDSNTAGQDNASYLLRLARYGDADAEGHFILCEDNSSGAAANGDDMFKVDATGAMTVAGTATLNGNVVRTGQQYVQTIGYCKVGSTGGWVIPAAADAAHLATLPQSQTASTLIIPITIPLKVGWTITAWTLNGQIDSAGNTATLDAKLYEHVEATAGFSNAAIGSGMAQLSKTADYKVVEGESSLTETVAVGDSYYLLITGTTAATTDIEIAGITVTVSEL